MSSSDDSGERGGGDLGRTIETLAENHLGDGASDFTFAEGRRRFVAGVQALKPYASRTPLWARFRGLVPGTLVLGAIALTVGIIDVAYRQSATPVAERESAASGHVSTDPSLSDPGARDHAAREVIQLETSRAQSGATVQLVAGASVTLSHRTRGESRRVAANVYRVNLEYGEMTFTIDPHIRSAWTVQAGAYDVRVVGTIFTVKRDVEHQSTEVRVDRGRVTVSGANRDPRSGALGERTIMLEAGGTFRGTNSDFSIEQSPARPPAVAHTAPAAAALSAASAPSRPSAPSAPSAVAPAAPPERLSPSSYLDQHDPAAAPSSPPRSAPQASHTRARRLALATGGAVNLRDWTSYYSAGDYPAAWRAARSVGYDHLVATLDVTGLAHLADAARLSGDRGGAHDLLLTLRRRFPGSREAANAAFLLGRSGAEKPAELSESATWLQTYLTERPTGVYAEEARGRLMVVHQRAGHDGEARRAARAYLGLYPTGAYATVARALSE